MRASQNRLPHLLEPLRHNYSSRMKSSKRRTVKEESWWIRRSVYRQTYLRFLGSFTWVIMFDLN